jgi:hypothetical protein
MNINLSILSADYTVFIFKLYQEIIMELQIPPIIVSSNSLPAADFKYLWFSICIQFCHIYMEKSVVSTARDPYLLGAEHYKRRNRQLRLLLVLTAAAVLPVPYFPQGLGLANCCFCRI